MKGLIHKALIYVPSGFVTMVIAAAGVWEGFRDWIASAVSGAVIAMRHPVISAGAVLFVIVYVAALIWTSEGSTVDAEERAKAKAEKNRQRRHLVTVGRSLANGFRHANDDRTLLEFMIADGGYARVRPHFSQGFVAQLQQPNIDRNGMADTLLDEMDRLERVWKLV